MAAITGTKLNNDNSNGYVVADGFLGAPSATDNANARLSTQPALFQNGFTNTGTMSSTGVATLTGGETLGGPFKMLSANVTATGTTQLGAKAISASVPLTWVVQASTASTKGVRLPAAATGLSISIANVGAFGVKVYPSTNGKIGGASTNSADSTVLAINKMNTYVARNTTYWIVDRGA